MQLSDDIVGKGSIRPKFLYHGVTPIEVPQVLKINYMLNFSSFLATRPILDFKVPLDDS